MFYTVHMPAPAEFINDYITLSFPRLDFTESSHTVGAPALHKVLSRYPIVAGLFRSHDAACTIKKAKGP